MSATHGKKGVVYKWNGVASDLSSEPCTVSGNQAQITDTTKRLLNPNAEVVFTPTNSVNLLRIDYTSGTAYFDDAPGTTTCSGTGAYVPTTNLVKVGYLYEWSFSPTLDVSGIDAFQSEWKSFVPGQASATGSARGYFVGSNWWDDFEDTLDGTTQYFLLRLFTYDPDDDATGDHYDCWVVFTGDSVGAGLAGPVSEDISFTIYGYPNFVLGT